MRNINQTEWQELIANDSTATIIDARTPRESAEGIIENAMVMDIMDFKGFQQKASQLDSNKNYYVYCRSGVRSLNACNALEELGLDKTYNLLGGILAWKGEIVIPQ
ncbi:rhodanese-like domain-containing protein [Psychroserpens sp.]